MNLTVVLTTLTGREDLLERSLSAWHAAIDPRLVKVIHNDGRSVGPAWQEAVETCATEFLWLACDDAYPKDAAFGTNLDRVLAHERAQGVVCPVTWNADGSLQGSGGYGDTLRDGETARNCAFPLAPAEIFRQMIPFPPTSWFVDCWITERAHALDRGPMVTAGIGLVHERINWSLQAEFPAYEAWRKTQMAAA